MKKIEIKKINVISLMKVGLYISAVFALILFLILLIHSPVSYTMYYSKSNSIGKFIYFSIPLIMIFVHTLMFGFVAITYNLLASKFGGIKIEIE